MTGVFELVRHVVAICYRSQSDCSVNEKELIFGGQWDMCGLIRVVTSWMDINYYANVLCSAKTDSRTSCRRLSHYEETCQAVSAKGSYLFGKNSTKELPEPFLAF